MRFEGDSISFFDPQKDFVKRKVGHNIFSNYLLNSLKENGAVEVIYLKEDDIERFLKDI
jgi:hypothetical protein